MSVNRQRAEDRGAASMPKARLPLSQRHRIKSPGHLRKDGFVLAASLHLPWPYVSRSALSSWPGLPVLTWAGLLQWIYILPGLLWLWRRRHADAAIGMLMNAIGVFLVYALLIAVLWATT